MLCHGIAETMPFQIGHVHFKYVSEKWIIFFMQILYTSVCLSDTPSEPSDFFPMSVNYQERFSAAGRTRQVYHACLLF